MLLRLLTSMFGRTEGQPAAPAATTGTADGGTAGGMTQQEKAQALGALFGSVQPQDPEADPQAILADRVNRVELNQRLDAAKAEIEAQNPHITDEQFNDFMEALVTGDMGKAWSITEAANKAKLEAEQGERDEELKNVHTEGASRGDAQLDNSPPQSVEDGIQRSISQYTNR